MTDKKEELKVVNPAPDAPGKSKSTKDKICITTINRQTFIDYFKLHKKKNPKFKMKVVRKDCGCEFEFKSEKDIPEKDLDCKCGNKIIKYTAV